MGEIKASVWKQDANGEWMLFFNTERDDCLTKKQASSFNQEMFSSLELKFGTLVMTPKGIGRLTKRDDNQVSVRLSKAQEEETFKIDEVSNFFPCYVKVLCKEVSNWFRLILPSGGTVEHLKKLLLDAKIANFEENCYSLVANGIELKDEFSFEQLNFTNNSKVLMFKQKLKIFKLSRYSQKVNGWYSYTTDGIAFSSMRPIRLLGVGLFASYEKKTQTGTIKVCEDQGGNILYEEFVEIPPSEKTSKDIFQVIFKKGLTILPSVFYSIFFYSNGSCYLYYGTGGKKNITGEKEIEFTFKTPETLTYGTRAESGNFPEIYYSI